MKITEIENCVIKLTHNGTEYITEREVGDVGDELSFNLRDGAKWVNDKTGDYVPESYIFHESDECYVGLEKEMYGEGE